MIYDLDSVLSYLKLRVFISFSYTLKIPYQTESSSSISKYLFPTLKSNNNNKLKHFSWSHIFFHF